MIRPIKSHLNVILSFAKHISSIDMRSIKNVYFYLDVDWNEVAYFTM